LRAADDFWAGHFFGGVCGVYRARAVVSSGLRYLAAFILWVALGIEVKVIGGADVAGNSPVKHHTAGG
jgi:hypothetical protein